MTRIRLATTVTVLVALYASSVPQTPGWARARVYTPEQAARGAGLYQRACRECHGDDLEGREKSPALAGPAFAQRWEGATLKTLFEHMEQMPPGDPAKRLQAG